MVVIIKRIMVLSGLAFASCSAGSKVLAPSHKKAEKIGGRRVTARRPHAKKVEARTVCSDASTETGESAPFIYTTEEFLDFCRVLSHLSGTYKRSRWLNAERRTDIKTLLDLVNDSVEEVTLDYFREKIRDHLSRIGDDPVREIGKLPELIEKRPDEIESVFSDFVYDNARRLDFDHNSEFVAYRIALYLWDSTLFIPGPLEWAEDSDSE